MLIVLPESESRIKVLGHRPKMPGGQGLGLVAPRGDRLLNNFVHHVHRVNAPKVSLKVPVKRSKQTRSVAIISLLALIHGFRVICSYLKYGSLTLSMAESQGTRKWSAVGGLLPSLVLRFNDLCS